VIGAVVAVGALAGTTDAGSAVEACGRPTVLAAHTGSGRIGFVLFSGFDDSRRARVALGPARTGVLIDARLLRPADPPITLRGRRCADGATLGLRAFGGRQALTLPATIHGRGTASVSFRSPYRHYALYAFFDRPGTWRIELRRRGRLLGSLVVVAFRR
jgi:hypothetical protein